MSSPYYRFFTADYLLKAGHLSLLEHGVYRLLIDRYMATAAPLPFDLPQLYRLLHATSKEEQSAVQSVIEEFFKMDGNILRHRRCDAELAFQNRVTGSQRENALKRWGKDKEQKQDITCDGSSKAMPRQCQSESESESETYKNNHIGENSPSSELIATLVKKAKVTACPHQKIVSLWAELMPELPQVRILSSTMTAHMRARWRERATHHGWSSESQGIDYFKRFFEFCRRSPFLMGHAKPSAGRAAPFELTLAWAMGPENFANIINRKYHQGE